MRVDISNLIDSSICRVILIFAGAAIYVATLPVFGLSWLAWIALLPLLLLIKSSQSYKQVLFESLVYGLIYNLISFSWLLTLHPLTWQGFGNLESLFITSLAWLLPSIFHASMVVLFALLSRVVFNLSSEKLSLVNMFLISFLWTAIQHKLIFNCWIFDLFSTPINLLVYSQYKNTLLIQVADIIGASGLEFLIIFVNVYLLNFFILDQYDRQSYQTLTLVIALLLLIIFSGQFFYGVSSVNSYQKSLDSSKNKHSFAVAQAGLAAKEIRGEGLDAKELIGIHEKISQKLDKRKDLLIWPEGAIPSYNRAEIEDETLPILQSISRVFVFGTYYTNSKDKETYNSIEIREDRILDIQTSFYHKRRLVPFGEYTPKLFGPLDKLARSTVGDGFASADFNQKPVKVSFGKIGFSICFELLFPELLRQQVLNGAELIINLNDLSWFRSKMVKDQFLAIAVLRAVENNRDILLAGNAGYSALVNSVGQISSKTKYDSADLLTGFFRLNKNTSFYSKYGW